MLPMAVEVGGGFFGSICIGSPTFDGGALLSKSGLWEALRPACDKFRSLCLLPRGGVDGLSMVETFAWLWEYPKLAWLGECPKVSVLRVYPEEGGGE